MTIALPHPADDPAPWPLPCNGSLSIGYLRRLLREAAEPAA